MRNTFQVDVNGSFFHNSYEHIVIGIPMIARVEAQTY